MSPKTHDPELTALETTLSALAPTPGAIDRDQLLFRAGQASVPKRGWFWPSTALALALLASALELTHDLRPEPPSWTRIVVVRVEAPAPTEAPVAINPAAAQDSAASAVKVAEQPPAPLSWYRLEELALRFGVEALPNAPALAATERSEKAEAVLKLRDHNNLLGLETP